MPESDRNYLAYLVRLWREDQATPWRASLQAPGDGGSLHFSSLAALFTFLQEQTHTSGPAYDRLIAGDTTTPSD